MDRETKVEENMSRGAVLIVKGRKVQMGESSRKGKIRF
jgi:hypothetical protein